MLGIRMLSYEVPCSWAVSQELNICLPVFLAFIVVIVFTLSKSRAPWSSVSSTLWIAHRQQEANGVCNQCQPSHQSLVSPFLWPAGADAAPLVVVLDLDETLVSTYSSHQVPLWLQARGCSGTLLCIPLDQDVRGSFFPAATCTASHQEECVQRPPPAQQQHDSIGLQQLQLQQHHLCQLQSHGAYLQVGQRKQVPHRGHTRSVLYQNHWAHRQQQLASHSSKLTAATADVSNLCQQGPGKAASASSSSSSSGGGVGGPFSYAPASTPLQHHPQAHKQPPRTMQLVVYERPGLRQFLRQLSQFAQPVLFTAAAAHYAQPMTQWLDPDGSIFGGRCLHRGHCAQVELPMVWSESEGGRLVGPVAPASPEPPAPTPVPASSSNSTGGAAPCGGRTHPVSSCGGESGAAAGVPTAPGAAGVASEHFQAQVAAGSHVSGQQQQQQQRHRRHEGTRVAKDLTQLGCDLSRVVLVDNSHDSFLLQPSNGLPCRPFHGHPGDDHLNTIILPLLRSLAHFNDVRPVLEDRFRMAAWFRQSGMHVVRRQQQ